MFWIENEKQTIDKASKESQGSILSKNPNHVNNSLKTPSTDVFCNSYIETREATNNKHKLDSYATLITSMNSKQIYSLHKAFFYYFRRDNKS